jgi:hypothetical protein
VLLAGRIDGDVHFHGIGGREPAPDDRAWLRALWTVAERAKAVVELRYIGDPGASSVDAYLVVRTAGPDQAAALESAGRLRAHLQHGMPRHAEPEPVTSEVELCGILTPFQPDPAGLVEIRKALTVARPARGGTGSPWLASVTPWRRDDRSWGPLWSELATAPFRMMLSVGLMAYRVGDGLRALLADRAAMLSMLASPGPSLTHSVYGGPQPADQFAVQAHPLLTDAVRRYTDIAFQIRVSLAAQRPVSEQLAETVASTISPRIPDLGMTGAAAVAVRPRAGELDVAWGNVTALNFAPLPAAHLQGCAPEAVGDLERTLGAIADIDEAAAAFRLPYRESARSSVLRPVRIH